MSKIIKLGIVLLIITAVTGIILGGIYTVTLEPIRATKEREKMEALSATLPGATDFKPIDISGTPGIIKEINQGSANGSLIGYNFTVTPKGYGGPIEMVVGIKKDGELMDMKILKHNETPGLGAKASDAPFAKQFKGKKVSVLTVIKTPAVSENDIQAISGATITSNAVATGVNSALDYWKTNFMEGKNLTTPTKISAAPSVPKKDQESYR